MVVQDERLITLNLLNLEIMGSTIAIIGLSIFILTSYRAKNIILNSGGVIALVGDYKRTQQSPRFRVPIE